MSSGTTRFRVWAAGCAVLAICIVSFWLSLDEAGRFSPPTSPLDRVAGLDTDARLGWAFLWQARDVLPPGATYTVRASNLESEMSLYMLSLGVLQGCTGLPSSYFGSPTLYAGNAARFILVYRCETVPENAVVRARLDDGCIYERRAN